MPARDWFFAPYYWWMGTSDKLHVRRNWPIENNVSRKNYTEGAVTDPNLYRASVQSVRVLLETFELQFTILVKAMTKGEIILKIMFRPLQPHHAGALPLDPTGPLSRPLDPTSWGSGMLRTSILDFPASTSSPSPLPKKKNNFRPCTDESVLWLNFTIKTQKHD